MLEEASMMVCISAGQRCLGGVALGVALGVAIALIPAIPPAIPAPLPASLLRQSSAPATPPPNRTRTPVTLPPPPATPPPNRTRSGGSLSGGTCLRPEPMVALVPVENPVLTTLAHPTVLVYVPYTAAEVHRGEVSVLVGLDERTRLYQARFTLPETPGIVSISIPPVGTDGLPENVPHHWYVKLYCTGNLTATADLTVDGWVQRVPATPERSRQIEASTPDVWYDALAQLGDRLRLSPQDGELRERWRNLLEFIGSANLAEENLVGPVQMGGDRN
ncbi:MAG: DUF928 domain-containing protein [Synechococcales bacterium]|nr:DUF928 domain-containing protein [Synechococcales bacterium]